MNSKKDLAKRLLKLYPVKTVKEHFSKDGKRQGLIKEIVEGNTIDAVHDFAYNNINQTKQHIYIYDLENSIDTSRFSLADFPYEVVKKDISTDTNRESSIICLPVIQYRIYRVTNTETKEETISFYQPVSIRFNPTHLIIQATIHERNIKSLYPDDKSVTIISKTNGEKDIVPAIETWFCVNDKQCDINKGVKKIWDADLIDAIQARWKKSKSAMTESMDDECTLKKDYPDQYKEVMKHPLNKTVFQYMKNDALFVDHFASNPTRGEISIPIFPQDTNQISHVINQILSNN